uniref:Peroxiredoxin n=1 Tax=candidate division WWE3 bacterium TaxID=2053526 RepID=A0A832E0Y8_UNCKA
MIEVSKTAPGFSLPGYYQGQEMKYALADYRGRWVVVFFYTGDRTSVCSTEVTAFNDHLGEFDALKVSVLGVSGDALESHRNWADELKLNYPLLSDESGDVSRLYDVYDEQGKHDFRGTFIIDPEGILRYLAIGEPKVGRGISETLRVVQALQTGEACPVDWQPGQPTLGK